MTGAAGGGGVLVEEGLQAQHDQFGRRKDRGHIVDGRRGGVGDGGDVGALRFQGGEADPRLQLRRADDGRLHHFAQRAVLRHDGRLGGGGVGQHLGLTEHGRIHRQQLELLVVLIGGVDRRLQVVEEAPQVCEEIVTARRLGDGVLTCHTDEPRPPSTRWRTDFPQRGTPMQRLAQRTRADCWNARIVRSGARHRQGQGSETRRRRGESHH